jgi:hypothetical protein
MTSEHDKAIIERQLGKLFSRWYANQKEGDLSCNVSDHFGDVFVGLPFNVAEQLVLARECFIDEMCFVFQKYPKAFEAWRIQQEQSTPRQQSG